MTRSIRMFALAAAVLGVAIAVPAAAQHHGKASGKTTHGAINTLTPAEQKAGWKLLFDGKTTDGWHNFGRTGIEGWEVKDGVLIALGKGGDHGNDIVTNEEYSNFELLVDWKVSPKANSGIFYNVVEEGFDRIYASAPEYQIIDEDGWDGPLEPWQKAGANYAMHPPLVKATRPVGDWNTSKIVVNKGKVEHWLNGKKTAAYELWTPEWDNAVKTGKWKDFPGYGRAKQGKIGLQDHGNVVYFRNIKIRPLTAK